MTQPSTAPVRTAGQKTRKMILQMVVGALVGGGVTFALLTTVGKSGFDLEDPSRVIALLAGLMFALMGVFVGLGVAVPGPGARLLNVEDAEELREQRKPLWRGSVLMVLVGAAMLALALASVDGSIGVLSGKAAAVIVVVCFIGIAAMSVATRNDYDELMLAVASEASAAAMYVTLVLFGIWGAFAHLGYFEWIGPLGLLGGLLLVNLVAIFWVSARRGLLHPR